MLLVLASLLGAVALAVVCRLLWLNRGVIDTRRVLLAVGFAVVAGLALLLTTGRLHWVAAAIGMVLPFMKVALKSLVKGGVLLLRWLPWIRQRFHHANTPGPGSTPAMTPQAAREILGLGEAPSKEQIVAAHRRLIQRVHPDRGGSNYLAQQLNDAKRLLLKDL